MPLSHPIAALVVALIGVGAGIIAWRRRILLGTAPRLLLAGALGCMILAAGGVRWLVPRATPVVVMVDLSPSTRGAAYRAPEHLRARVTQLLGGRSHRFLYFAEHTVDSVGPDLPELPADRTVYQPPTDAPAVVLFSDGRFPLPRVAPPTFAVIDPGLLDPHDGAVRELSVQGERIHATFTVEGPARSAQVVGADQADARALSAPGERLSLPVAPDAVRAEALLDPADRWPENDAMRATVLPESPVPWWISARPAPDGFRAIPPGQVPVDPAAYLDASAIVLDNIPADALGVAVQQRLDQFVRDLGGALIVTGGDRAFGAGGYAASALDDLLPLGSAPPRPTIHWMLLTDASGSMEEPADPGTRWERAVDALRRALEALPREDRVSIGGFSRQVRWWTEGRPVRQARSIALPPVEEHPHGPTNLESALSGLAQATSPGMPTRALVMTDAHATIDDPKQIARQLLAAQVQLSVLLIGEGPAAPALRDIATDTGGSARLELHPDRWATAVDELMRTAAPDHLQQQQAVVNYQGMLSGWSALPVSPWNRAWLKPDATLLGQTTDEDQPLPMVARWQRGLGTVLAVGYPTPIGQIIQLVEQLQRSPSDPRYRVRHHPDEDGWRVVVERDLADDPPALGLVDASTEQPMHATAPGVFMAVLPPDTAPRVVRLVAGDRTLRLLALPGGYAPEFDAVGVDTARLVELAGRTGGAVIHPAQRTPIDLPRSVRYWSLGPLLSAGAAVLIAAALMIWQRRR